MSFTITSALRWWARETPDALAVCVDGNRVGFAELAQWSDRVGAQLSARGVEPGDRVSVIGLNSVQYAALIFGLMKIGAILAPFNFRFTRAELDAGLEDTTPKLLFADDERMVLAREAAAHAGIGCLPFSVLDDWRRTPGDPPAHDPHKSDVVGIIFTSGSTAKPKGVIHTHESVTVYACEFALMEPGCARGAKTINFGPFSSGSGFLLLTEFVVLGASQFIESRFDPERAVRIMIDEQINVFQAVPIFFERVSQTAAFADADFSSLRWTQVGGARVSPALLKAWRDKGVLLRPLYGQTEAGGGWGARGDALEDPAKCGRGGLFSEFAVKTDKGRSAPGVQGEIMVRAPGMMPGYWNNPEANGKVFEDGWLMTGDLGVMDERGNLTFIDRLKDIIISGGLNISAAEVEHVISEVEGVEEVAVIAAEDAEFGETPLAIIYGDGVSPEAVVARCAALLSNYKVPRYVVLAEEPLPRVATGKISKPALRAKYKDAAARLPRVR